MGQEILYCYKCQTRLMGSEFERGKAFKVGGQASCAKCVQDLIAAMPDLRAEVDRAKKLSSTSRIPTAASESSTGRFKAAARAAAPPPPSPPPESKTGLIVGLVIGGIVLVLLLAMAMGGGRTPTRSESPINTPHLPLPPSPVGRPDDPQPPPPPPPPPSTPFAAELREIDEKLRTGLANEEFRPTLELLESARKRRATPDWLAEIDLRIPQVEARARRSSIPIREKAAEARKRGDAAEVKRLRDKVASWGFASLVEEFDKSLTEPAPPPPSPPPPPPPPPIAGSTEPPHVVYADALGAGCRNSSWGGVVDYACSSPVHEGTRSIAFTPQQMAAGIYLALDQSVDPKQYPFVTFAIYLPEDSTGAGVALYTDWKPAGAVNLDQLGGHPKTREWKRYVLPVSQFNPAGQKLTGFIVQVYKIGTTPLLYLDSVAFLKNATVAVPNKPPGKELDDYRARWSQAAVKASHRDYVGAQRDLEEVAGALKEDAAKAEAAADLELLKLAAQVPVEALRIIEKWPKGHKVKVDYLNGAGERETAEGAVIAADALRVSLTREAGPIDLPIAELLPSTLAELFRGRADRKPTDARAAAAFCCLEGDNEAGRKLWGENAPEKLLKIARDRSEAEAAARRLFWTAEADFAAPRRRAAAIESFTTLLAGEAIPRLRPYLSARLESARDTVFLADDLTTAGTFAPAMAGGKVDAFWLSGADGSAAKMRENYVEAEYHAFPGAAYRAWIWAGACCVETFDFAFQGSELTAPNPKNSKEPLPCEPGGEHSLAGKPPSATLKRWHAQHGGPKEPARWEWIPVTLPKFQAAGPRKLRVLTSQQGFSVAAIVVSSSRRETPREAEMKELEKSRFGSRKAVNYGPLGTILHEYWLNIDGETIEELTRHPVFQGKPSGSSLRDLFEGPRNMDDRYGSRMRGFVHPPVTGAYTFWISSDDCSELWLSSDEAPYRKRLIANCNAAGGVRDWTRTPACKSAPIALAAGKRYYIEALQKDGGGDDHLAVGWTLPDGADERPIPGTRLAPWNAVPAPPGPAGYVFYRGINLHGPATVIDGRKWEGKGTPNLTSSDGFENQSVTLVPPTDEARTSMIRDSVFTSGATTVKLTGVPPANYVVFLYVWEDNDAQIFDVLVQGKLTIKGYNSGTKGHWSKLGPLFAPVTDGTLELRSSGGDANFSGLEVWRSGK